MAADSFTNSFTTGRDMASGAASRLGARADGLKGRVVGGFGRLVDALEPHIDKAPADFQPAARKAVSVARERPLLTMAGLAIGALILTRGARRR